MNYKQNQNSSNQEVKKFKMLKLFLNLMNPEFLKDIFKFLPTFLKILTILLKLQQQLLNMQFTLLIKMEIK